MKQEIKVILPWDPKNTALFTEKLYRHVRRKEVEFSVTTSQESSATTFIITTQEGSGIIPHLMQYLRARAAQEKSKGRTIAEPEVYRCGKRWDPQAGVIKLTAWYGPKRYNHKLEEF